MENVHSHSPKQYRASIARRLSGRPSADASTSSLHSITSQSSLASSFKLDSNTSQVDSPRNDGAAPQPGRQHSSEHLVSQIAAWLQEEKAKRRARRTGVKGYPSVISAASGLTRGSLKDAYLEPSGQRPRRSSETSDGGLSLERLEQILAEHRLANPDNRHQSPSKERKGSYFPRRTSSIRKLRKGGSTTASTSDTEYQDGDVLVPTAEVYLDNSKTFGYFGGAADLESDLSSSSKRAAKDGWLTFKQEILRLAHTLRLKGWRRVPLERGADIDVERLSGALTNAVYVVSPPKNLQQTPSDKDSSTAPLAPKKPPPWVFQEPIFRYSAKLEPGSSSSVYTARKWHILSIEKASCKSFAA